MAKSKITTRIKVTRQETILDNACSAAINTLDAWGVCDDVTVTITVNGVEYSRKTVNGVEYSMKSGLSAKVEKSAICGICQKHSTAKKIEGLMVCEDCEREESQRKEEKLGAENA